MKWGYSGIGSNAGHVAHWENQIGFTVSSAAGIWLGHTDHGQLGSSGWVLSTSHIRDGFCHPGAWPLLLIANAGVSGVFGCQTEEGAPGFTQLSSDTAPTGVKGGGTSLFRADQNRRGERLSTSRPAGGSVEWAGLDEEITLTGLIFWFNVWTGFVSDMANLFFFFLFNQRIWEKQTSPLVGELCTGH